jgi:ornithine cyclodeaminase
MLILNASELRHVLDMRSCIEAMERVFLDLANDAFFLPPRSRVSPDQSPNWMTFMPTLRTQGVRRWALKQMVVTPGNRDTGLDPIQGTVVLQDGDDGRPLALADAKYLTAIRTAAVTALATRTLANPDAKVVAILGTGVQARLHVEAMRCIFPDASIRVWGRTADRARRFAEEVGCDLEVTAQGAVRSADVICTVTAAKEPIVCRAWFKPGAHLNAVGSSHATAREIDAESIAAATLFVDRTEAALRESGDVLGAIRDGAITAAHPIAELGAVLAGNHPGRSSPDEFTLYKSLGLGAQDLAALETAVERARALGRGIDIDW